MASDPGFDSTKPTVAANNDLRRGRAHHRGFISTKILPRLMAWLRYVLLFGGAAGMMLPFYWALVTSIKLPAETIAYPVIWLPSEITFAHYQTVLRSNILIYYRNSTIVALLILMANIFTSTMGGFLFAKYQFPFKEAWFLLLLSLMMIPFVVGLIPLYLLVTGVLRLKDSLWAMVIPSLVSPFGIFLMRQFIQTIPDELLDAARIDGASDWYIFTRIIMPLSKPALSALAIFLLIGVWNDFLWPLLVSDSDRSRTLPIGVALFTAQRWTQYNVTIAASILVLAPMVLFFLIFQRAFVKGIVLTGMKF